MQNVERKAQMRDAKLRVNLFKKDGRRAQISSIEKITF
jgi:hypothetical protein